MAHSINKKLANLTPKQFEGWFKERKFNTDLDWQKEYKKIGGKIESKKARTESPKD